MTPEESDPQQRKCLKSVDFGLFGIFGILVIFVRVLDAWDFGCLWFCNFWMFGILAFWYFGILGFSEFSDLRSVADLRIFGCLDFGMFGLFGMFGIFGFGDFWTL